MKSLNCDVPVAAAAAAAQGRPPLAGWPERTASQPVPGAVRVQRSSAVNPRRLVPAGLAREWRGGSRSARRRHRQAAAGTRGPRWSEGSRPPLPLPPRPGRRGTACCPGTPRTRRTQGWSRPGSQSGGVSFLFFFMYTLVSRNISRCVCVCVCGG